MRTDDTNAARRGSESNDLLGPLPEPLCSIGVDDGYYTAEQMRAERCRCFGLGLELQRERCAKLALPGGVIYSDDEWRVRREVRASILVA